MIYTSYYFDHGTQIHNCDIRGRRASGSSNGSYGWMDTHLHLGRWGCSCKQPNAQVSMCLRWWLSLDLCIPWKVME